MVVATQLPFLDRGLFFAKAHPTKSYVVAAPIDDERAPRGMYISVDRPTRSMRSTPADERRADPDRRRRGAQARLEPTPRRAIGGSRRFSVRSDSEWTRAEYRWSTHDYVPLDKLPYIGRLRRGDDRLYVATGFAKWGMTKGTLAAAIIRDAVLGRTNE